MSVVNRTCRTCGKASELSDDWILYSLYNSIEYKPVLNVVLEECEIWNLNISENDGLPQQICFNCFDSFCQIHNFRMLCIESQMNFGEMCTGLDIIIKDKLDDNDSSESFDEEGSVIVQEHYAFPEDESQKSPVTTSPTDLVESNKQSPLLEFDEENAAAATVLNNMEDDSFSSENKYPCEFCMGVISFDDADLLKEHCNQFHSTTLPYLCPKCDKSFESKIKRNNHVRIHNRKTVECEKCGKKIRAGNKAMMQHVENNHIEKDRECSTCGKKFKMISLKQLKYHSVWHDDSKLHKCKYCDKKFIQTNHLKVHERMHTGERPFKCSQCGLAFKNSNLLSNHIKFHEGKTIPCPECPKKFFHSHALKLHMKTHNPDRKDIKCELCDKAYKSLVNLSLHKHRVHGAPATPAIMKMIRRQETKPAFITPYKCNLCPLAYVLHTELVKHLKTHSENRPYSCKICHKRFKRLAHLKLHMDSLHLNKKPHICGLCGWAFPQRNNLRQHYAAKHDNIKDHKCEICQKEFATLKTLKTHMVIHSEKKPFVCKICNKSFKQQFVLKTHINIHLRKNEANIDGGDILDDVVEE